MNCEGQSHKTVFTDHIFLKAPFLLTSGYETANKPEIKKERTHGEKKGEKREKTTTTLSEKKDEASNVGEQRDKGWMHVIRVHDTTHLAVTTTRQGKRLSRTTPHKERIRGLFKQRDYPPHSYIVNERYNSRKKRASQEKKQ